MRGKAVVAVETHLRVFITSFAMRVVTGTVQVHDPINSSTTTATSSSIIVVVAVPPQFEVCCVVNPRVGGAVGGREGKIGGGTLRRIGTRDRPAPPRCPPLPR